MSFRNAPPDDFGEWQSSAGLQEVDDFGVPLDTFGLAVPPEFFEILGRVIAVSGKIEYFKDRLAHLPKSETEGVRKVEQFLKRYDSGKLERNSIVHSYWVFGANPKNSDIILGVRYKLSNSNYGNVASVSMRDITDSAKEQVFVQYSLDDLRKVLRRNVTTLLIGESAHTVVNMNWAIGQDLEVGESPTS